MAPGLPTAHGSAFFFWVADWLCLLWAWYFNLPNRALLYDQILYTTCHVYLPFVPLLFLSQRALRYTHYWRPRLPWGLSMWCMSRANNPQQEMPHFMVGLPVLYAVILHRWSKFQTLFPKEKHSTFERNITAFCCGSPPPLSSVQLLSYPPWGFLSTGQA